MRVASGIPAGCFGDTAIWGTRGFTFWWPRDRRRPTAAEASRPGPSHAVAFRVPRNGYAETHKYVRLLLVTESRGVDHSLAVPESPSKGTLSLGQRPGRTEARPPPGAAGGPAAAQKPPERPPCATPRRGPGGASASPGSQEGLSHCPVVSPASWAACRPSGVAGRPRNADVWLTQLGGKITWDTLIPQYRALDVAPNRTRAKTSMP